MTLAMTPHSPIIFWLLLAATIAVDAVAFSCVRSAPEASLAGVAFEALVVSQLSIVSIWCALAARNAIWAVVGPLLAIAAAWLATWNASRLWADMLPYYGLHVALLWGLLKTLERTPFWRRRSNRTASWRYSMTQLLLIMTIVAVLLPAVLQSEVFNHRDSGSNVAFIAGSLCLTLACVVFLRLSIPWLP